MHCGLDFGTSNSTLGTTDAAGTPRLLPLEGDRLTLPSAVFFDFDKDEVLFGRRALAEYIAGGDGRLLRALKTILGSDLAAESIRIKRDIVPFANILGLFVAELKHRGEADLETGLDRAVVGRPVHFVDDDAAADARAQQQLESTVRAQGFRHVEFQFEPIAAALDYERQVTREELGLVIDLGGGTSDFSIVRVSPERARVADRQGDILATTGVHIGGTDFDRMLSMARVMPELGFQTPTLDGKRPLPSGPYYDLATWHRINRLYTPHMLTELRHTRREARDPERVERMISIVAHREGHALAAAVETAKIALTDAEAAVIAFAGEETKLAVPVTRTELARALQHAIDRIAATIAMALKAAGLGPNGIDTLILTGGSTQIPAIMARLRALFPDARFVATDAFGSVGLGLALDAARKFR
ncbi:MAG: Hsp70 family protein [Devosia sp.]|nr:Hsp70 family protein [Devosia sp.]